MQVSECGGGDTLYTHSVVRSESVIGGDDRVRASFRVRSGVGCTQLSGICVRHGELPSLFLIVQAQWGVVIGVPLSRPWVGRSVMGRFRQPWVWTGVTQCQLCHARLSALTQSLGIVVPAYCVRCDD